MNLRSSLALLFVLLLYALPAAAATRLHADTLALPGMAMQDVTLQMAPAGDGTVTVSLDAGRLDLAVLGWHGVVVTCAGGLQRQGQGRWVFRGDLAARGTLGGAMRQAEVVLVVDKRQNTLNINIDDRGHKLQVAMPLDDMRHVQARLTRLPVDWLQGVLAGAWADGELGKGFVSATMSADVQDDGIRSAGQYKIDQLAFDSRDGRMAGAHLDSSGRWHLHRAEDTLHLDISGHVDGGELLLGPLYANLPEQPARVAVTADVGPGGVRIDRLEFDDGRNLRLDAQLAFDAGGQLSRIRLEHMRAVFPGAQDHYLKTLLVTAGFDDLAVEGLVTATGLWDAGHFKHAEVMVDNINIADPSGRIGSNALGGTMHWSATGNAADSSLAWQGLDLLGLQLGAARTHWQSRDGTLALARAARIPMLGGQVFINQLAWSPEARKHADKLEASLAYSGIDLAALSRSFGWPAFQGTLGGAIPGLHYDGQTLSLDGGVSVNVFDGFVDVTEMKLKHPFGVAPVLTATVNFRDLDLEPMTKVFGFGSITGRLHGHVHGLRMVSWRPVAFAARLLADDGGRISQKAVNSISSLGGGAMAQGLKSTVLRVFDSFGYDRIGLSCVLHDGICDMHGLGEADGGGYNIVEGSGLPHIAVIGHQHKVDWPTLVARLKAATAGGEIKIE